MLTDTKEQTPPNPQNMGIQDAEILTENLALKKEVEMYVPKCSAGWIWEEDK